MKTITLFLALALAVLLTSPAQANNDCHELLNFNATKLRSSETVDFCEQFVNKALLVVNTASQCGFTPQFKGLEALHKTYGDKLAIVGFPSNDFNQEHADEQKVADVCYVNYGVTFIMLEPSSVTGKNANKMFRQLGKETGNEPDWNFNKYLISADGETIKHFGSRIKPMSKSLRGEIDKLVAMN